MVAHAPAFASLIGDRWTVLDHEFNHLPDYQGLDNPERRRALALVYDGPVETAQGFIAWPDWTPACEVCGERPALGFHVPFEGKQMRVCQRHTERG